MNKEELLASDLPLLPSEFESLVKKQCWEAHEELRKTCEKSHTIVYKYHVIICLCFYVLRHNRWVPACAQLFMEQRALWEHLMPQDESDTTELAQEFFACVAAVMSQQLRGMVINSLDDFLDFFQIHAKGNDFEEEYDELQYVMKQVMIVKVFAEDPKLMFEPTFGECWEIILRCFSEIISSASGLQRVSVQKPSKLPQ